MAANADSRSVKPDRGFRVGGLLVAALLWLGPGVAVRGGQLELRFPTALADSFQYSYDPASGRITQTTDTTTGQVAQYSYDAVGNIKAVQVVNPTSTPLAVNGGTTSTTYTGQGELLTFSGNAGQYLSLSINYLSSSIPGVSILILNPDGSKTTALSIVCPNGGVPPTCPGAEVINLSPLPATGTYQIVVEPKPGYSGSGTLNFALTASWQNAWPVILDLILSD